MRKLAIAGLMAVLVVGLVAMPATAGKKKKKKAPPAPVTIRDP